MQRPPRFGTFSIVAYDRAEEAWGVAVQSKFLAVGAVVPWAEAKVGAIATQAEANVRYGPEGLALLRSGATATDVVRKLTSGDPGRDKRQLGVVDARGGSASFTGEKCMPWAGHVTGEGFACQGNILFGERVVPAMARAFESTPGGLPERLLAALSAAQREGGDRRGMQSAALLIVREKGGYDQGSDRWVDIRVDDHPSPIEELKRIFQIYDLMLLSREDPATLIPIEGEAARAMQHDLGLLGYYSGRMTGSWDEATQAAFDRFLGEHNFENKARTDGRVWPTIVNYLADRAREESARRTHAQPVVPGALERGPGAAAPGQGTTPTPAPAPASRKRRPRK